VDVNEEGTEAAAATGIEMRPTSFSMFVVDHPFVFLIRDHRSGSLLFLGRVTNPLG
jgi:serpin B